MTEEQARCLLLLHGFRIVEFRLDSLGPVNLYWVSNGSSTENNSSFLNIYRSLCIRKCINV